MPLAEALAVLRFRLWTALGGAVTGILLFVRLQNGMAPTDPAISNRLHLIDALDDFLAYAGFALLLLALLALIPTGGGLALATTGVAAGTMTAEAAVQAAAMGTLGIALMAAPSGGASGDSTSPRESGQGSQQGDGAESTGRARVRRGKEYEDYLQDRLGGNGSFKAGKREFDGSSTRSDGTEVWYEAKSGRYWELASGDPKVLAKFKSNLGEARLIAEENGRQFELVSDKPIPDNIVRRLSKKNYTWRVVPKEPG
ncbi:hypothetical protein RKE29_20315 [Streptomyces sp. B1866]|uniref:hypothetical protein n=1 Tax=Streptomyces sp. B1866 TaxID=3075431 RepID=UPI00288F7555|nr:hypothetical protein [Streptomyces sp. B1866]MDT3398959.1 hypothetical protein [Streptomyces sp. B1866]